ncbi:hypothetical protein [Morganella morganii]|uniref:hypothetical protein n=1 Tax=Morganella morganii TaxID=582 RepID=UPI000468912A|nr:hypothetical protein [Morganella morganii]
MSVKSVWDKNSLPVLEYCRIDRAAELLGCKVIDILNLADTKKIKLSLLLNELPAFPMLSEESISALYQYYDESNHYRRLVFSPAASMQMGFYDNTKKNIPDLGANPIYYLSGIWNFSILDENAIGGGFFQSLEQNSYNLDYSHLNLNLSEFNNVIFLDDGEISTALSDVDFKPIDIFYSHSITTLDLYLSRIEIERIYTCRGASIVNTWEDTFSRNSQNKEISDEKSRNRTTANQATYIKFLLLMNGFSDDDLKKSPQTLIDAISAMASKARLEMPIISENTMKDWLSRARDIKQVK